MMCVKCIACNGTLDEGEVEVYDGKGEIVRLCYDCWMYGEVEECPKCGVKYLATVDRCPKCQAGGA